MGLMTRHNRMVRERERLKKLSRPVPMKVEQEPTPEYKPTFEDQVRALGLSRTEINLMTKDKLQQIASDFGVEDAFEMSGATIKRMMLSAIEED